MVEIPFIHKSDCSSTKKERLSEINLHREGNDFQSIVIKYAVKSAVSGILFHILTVLSTYFSFFLPKHLTVLDIHIYLFEQYF
jgi:hypothetical protein